MMETLIWEYMLTLSMVRRAHKRAVNNEDQGNLGSTISDLIYSIDYMKTGRVPGCRRGINRRSTEQREIPYDPKSYVFIQNAVLNSQPDSGLSEEKLELLKDLLAKLTKREREVYELVHGRNYTWDETANLLGISKSTVQQFLLRAEKKLSFVVQKPPISEKNFSVENVQRVMFND